MVESRWVRWVGPGVIALGAVGLITSAELRRRAIAHGCPAPAPARQAIGSRPPGTAAWRWRRCRASRGSASTRGSMTTGRSPGSELRVGLGGGRTQRLIDLPAESFVAGPFGRVVLVGSDDGDHLEGRRDRRRQRVRLDDRRRTRRHPSGDHRPRRRLAVRGPRRTVDTRRSRHLAAAGRRSRTGATGPGTAPIGRSVRADVLDDLHLGRHGPTAGGPGVRRDRLPDARPVAGRRTGRDARRRRTLACSSGSTAIAW